MCILFVLNQSNFYSANSQKECLLVKIHCGNKKYFDAAAQFRLFRIELLFFLFVIAIAVY